MCGLLQETLSHVQACPSENDINVAAGTLLSLGYVQPTPVAGALPWPEHTSAILHLVFCWLRVVCSHRFGAALAGLHQPHHFTDGLPLDCKRFCAPPEGG